jgi:hypothetical protein
MSSPWLLPSIFGIALLVLCGMAYLAGAGFRTWNLATCWSCGATKVRRSASRSWLDALATVFFLAPYRCAGCRVRFYGFRTSSIEPSIPMAAAATARLRQRRFPIRVKVTIRLTAGSESPLTIFAFIWAHARLTSMPALFSARLFSDLRAQR